MDEWNTRQHGQSGLIERVRRSKLTAQDAEQQTLEFLKNGSAQKLARVIRSVRIAVSYIV
jgi:oligoribonuclease